MKVETFECQETIAEPLEIAEEAIKLIEEMELEGQKKLIASPTEGTDKQSRCPYRKMKTEELFVYRNLCPKKQMAQNYDGGPIPIRVLQVMHHALSLDFFKRVEIWSADAEVKDPVLVAFTESERNIPFILARWADELDEWPILFKKAKQAWKRRALEEMAKIKMRFDRDIADIENDAKSMEDMVSRDLPSYFSWI